jgi:hypothetical protein
MAEGVVAQVKETPAVVASTVRHRPVLAIGVGIVVLLGVLILEAFKPGLITGPLRKLLSKIGFKTA